MLAIISDIHSNVEALTAVLADIDARGIKQIVCLGDVVGYGPQPRECVDMVMARATRTLLGNHDYAVLLEPHKFNVGAEAACYWTRQQLEDEPDAGKRAKRWDFIGAQIVKHVMDGKPWELGSMVFVHASPRRPVNEYIFPDDVYSNPARIASCFDRFDHFCFVGHTHVPGVFLETPDFYSPDEISGVWEVSSQRKVLVNVGSVGQPRDRDPRASYVVVEPGLVRFVRVEYDVEAVVQKVLAVPELDDYLGTRLRDGR
jgi:diadenosine tetraphosphatase ApaH/serine/threonine PP2A family protein phosphatase